MKWLYKIFRTLIVCSVALLLGLPALLYITLSLPFVQDEIGRVAERELSRLLGVQVRIEGVDIRPFNIVTLRHVTIADSTSISQGPIAVVDRLGAGINYASSLSHGRIVINYVELMGMTGRLWRASKDSPLNIQPIIDALSPKDKNKPPTEFDLEINSIVIRSTNLSYDILDMPKAEQGRFDPSHIALRDLRADIRLPRIRRDDYTVDVKQLMVGEKSGLNMRLSGLIHADSTQVSADGLKLTLGASSLSFGPLNLPIKSLKTIATDARTAHLQLDILPGSLLYPADFAPFVPSLASSTLSLGVELSAEGQFDDFAVERLIVTAPETRLEGRASVTGLAGGVKEIAVTVPNLTLEASGGNLNKWIGELRPLKPEVAKILSSAGNIFLDLSGQYAPSSASAEVTLDSEVLSADVKASGKGNIHAGTFIAEADAQVEGTRLESILPSQARLAAASVALKGRAGLVKWRPDGTEATLEIASADWNGYNWKEIKSTLIYDGSLVTLDVDSRDAGADMRVMGQVRISKDWKSFSEIGGQLTVEHLDFSRFPMPEKWRKFSLSTHGDMSVTTLSQDMVGEATFPKITLRDDAGEEFDFGPVELKVNGSERPMTASLTSPMMDAYLSGTIYPATLGHDVQAMLSSVYPSLVTAPKPLKKVPEGANDFSMELTVKDTRPIERIIQLPVSVVHPVSVNASVDAERGTLAMSMEAPYLLQKAKLIEGTALNVGIDAGTHKSGLYFATSLPTKKGVCSLVLEGDGGVDTMNMDLDWTVGSKRNMSGTLSLAGSAMRDDEGALSGEVHILPSTMTLTDSIWNIHESTVRIASGVADISRWVIDHKPQSLAIEGRVSPSADDLVKVSLSDIDLDYVFDMLNIPNVDFGGRATGVVEGSALLSKGFHASTEGLDVKGLSYNGCVFGDAMIVSAWDSEAQGITLDADIRRTGGRSTVKGIIYPLKNGGGLDLAFGADHTPVGFLQPFMSAFCSKVTGEVSGQARLFGTFSDLDLEGAAYAEKLRVTLPFTGTTYECTDSVRFTPGNITLSDITLHDADGNTARFGGWLKHRAFHDPAFHFSLTDARNFLGYDIPENDTQAWYGKIYVDGRADIIGRPGNVDINVNVSTAPKSTFGFILSDARQASEYTFITFRDATPESEKEHIAGDIRFAPEAVRKASEASKKAQEEIPTAINMSIDVDANPNVAVTLVMDPVAGDRIRAWGNGNLRMTYSSRSDEMEIYGAYSLVRGTYNFTLQDIIVKDFTIDPGSSITFHGNPLAAQLDITAAYQTTANLTDLDESFKDDKDLNRTSVPVRALLNVSGDMREPDLSFDIDFPTLSSDIDRKVRALVNTQEMVDRQVIYLLALNRFYTPEYNTGVARNNEFTSLVTNTLSSRVSSLLGTIDSNWSFAPTVRSDIGDFSDVEVGLALSSHLLNNRLFINGNLGYRDKSLNSTNFIGDFDVEYLLNRRGTIRLKAYNHFNDQTFSLKSAPTTQGAGVVWKLDFNRFDSWLKPFRRKKKEQEPAPVKVPLKPDSVPAPADTMQIIEVPALIDFE